MSDPIQAGLFVDLAIGCVLIKVFSQTNCKSDPETPPKALRIKEYRLARLRRSMWFCEFPTASQPKQTNTANKETIFDSLGLFCSDYVSRINVFNWVCCVLSGLVQAL